MELEQGNYYDSALHKKTISLAKNNGSFADRLTKEKVKAALVSRDKSAVSARLLLFLKLSHPKLEK